MAESRTKQTALETLESVRQDIAKKLDDREIARLLSPELLQAVFNESWKLQFNDDSAPFARAARDLVVEAVNQANAEKPK
jgi:hypothetical protein